MDEWMKISEITKYFMNRNPYEQLAQEPLDIKILENRHNYGETPNIIPYI